MSADVYVFTFKLAGFKALLNAFTGLPSYREAQIQVAKLERMTEATKKRHRSALFFGEPTEGKKWGKERHQLNQQGKIVDRLFVKLIEEGVVRNSQSVPGRPKLTPRKIRGTAQKFIHSINSWLFQAHQKALEQAFSEIAGQLEGLKPSPTHNPTSDNTAPSEGESK
jgi:hypothetical protein